MDTETTPTSPYATTIENHEGIGEPMRLTFDYHGYTRTVVNGVLKVTDAANIILVGFEVKKSKPGVMPLHPSAVKAYRWDEVERLRFARS